MRKVRITNGSNRPAVYESISRMAPDDIMEVAELSIDCFPRSRELSKEYMMETLYSLYFHEDRGQKTIMPLVNRSGEGNINGFLGVTVRDYQYKKRVIQVANCHHLMSTETARRKLVPMKLLQAFLSGPQDISFADGSVEPVRQLWKRLGGVISINDCIYYKVPLKPFSFVTRPFRERMKGSLSSIISGASSGFDSLGGILRAPLFYRPGGGNLRQVELSAGFLMTLLEKIKSDYTIFPGYTSSDLDRLFYLLAREPRYGTLHKVGLMDDSGDVVGSFVYYSQKGGVCDVMQAVSVAGREEALFNALTRHAWERGGIELSGRLMMSQLRTPFSTRAVCLPGRMWTLVQSDDKDLTIDVLSGQAFMTRLEGDLWLL